MSTGLIPSSTAPLGTNNHDATDFVQALNDLLPPQFAEFRAMKPELRETLAQTMWFHNTRELFHVVAPAILGTKFLCEILPVYAPMIRVLHRLAVANGKMAADDPKRRTWRMIGHVPTTSIKTNTDKEAVAVREDDAICWASVCAEVFRSTPQYVNKLTVEVPLLPPLPEEATGAEEFSDTGSRGADDGGEDSNKNAETKTHSATKKRAASRKRKTAKGAKSETEKSEPDTEKGVVLIPAPAFKAGDVEALYKFLDGNGCSGLVPLDAVFGGLEEYEFQSTLSRFCNKIAYAFHPNRLNVRVERVGEESKSPMHALKARVSELEADLAQVRGQMHMMVQKAIEIKDPEEWLEWINEQD